jgi:hypothetical protein
LHRSADLLGVAVSGHEPGLLSASWVPAPAPTFFLP